MMRFTTYPGLSVPHGFFGRGGGVSHGLYTSLNCGPGSNDNPAHIKENRARVARALRCIPDALCTLYQIHSADVVIVDTPFGDARPKADAMVTNTPGILLGILTADCAPVLFADEGAGVVGAAHAGWKGAFGGVVENTVAAMETLGARRENIRAAIGPCIAQQSYEVGPEFVARLVEAEAANTRFFDHASPTTHHAHFNLPAYVLSRLAAAGVRDAAWIGMDTRPDNAPFFSYRRTTLAGEPDYGRQLSVIALHA